MTNEYETVDLGNVKGDKGDTGNNGRGITRIFTEEIANTTPKQYQLQVLYDDGQLETIGTYYDGVSMTPVDTITENEIQPVTSDTLYRRFSTTDSLIDSLRRDVQDIKEHPMFTFVTTLPTGNSIDANMIYVLKNTDVAEANLHDEYIWDVENSRWEHLGALTVNFSNYYTKSQINQKISNNINADKNNMEKMPSVKATYDYFTQYYTKAEVDEMIGELQDFLHS